jgi:phosphoribosylformimino-5-aminoimidazole carboxamide ribotide isomerase
VEGWFDLGVARVVMGTAALKDPEFVRDMAREFPGGIVVAVDARDGLVATQGWAEVSDVPAVDLARRFEDAGVAALLFTDIGRDGLLKGCNIEATVDLARAVDLPVIASGGVKGLDDIRMLALHAADGIEGVITGRALYDGRLDLSAAIAMAERT